MNTIADLKNDIKQELKGTQLKEIPDFDGACGHAANRLLTRIDPEETRRIVTMATPFWDNINDYALVTDYKRMIDIYPQAGRQDQPGKSNFDQTTSRQFSERLDQNSFSIKWNNGVRSLQAQRLPAGNVATLDTFDSPTSNGSWSGEGDASNISTETLNFIQGNNSMSFDLSGATGLADVINTTAAATDFSAQKYNDTSFIYFYIPIGRASLFTSFTLRRGSSASAYKQATATAKQDGTSFSDGWNLLSFSWSSASTVGTPDDTQNTYRRFGINYTSGTAIPGCLLDSWTDSLGTLYNIEYYSECLFRSSTGAFKYVPTDDSDIINASISLYEIFKAELMREICRIVRVGSVLATQLDTWERILNGEPSSRYVPFPKERGLYENYLKMFPSSAIVTTTSYYEFDI